MRTFPRIASPSLNDTRRQSLHVGALSPCVIRVAHTPRTAKQNVQRSLVSIEQTLGRVDAQSNPIGSTKVSIALQCNIPSDVTLTEFREAFALLVGALLESDAALVTSVYNAEL